MQTLFILLFLVSLYIRPQDWVPGIIGFPTGIVILFPSLIAAYFHYLKLKDVMRVPQYGLLITYLVVVFVSTYWAAGFDVANEQLSTLAKRVAVFFLIVWSLTSIRRIRVVVRFVLVLSLFLAFQAILQAQTGESWGGMTPMPGYVETRVRWHGDWDGPNVFALLFIVAIGFSLELAFGAYGIGVRAIGLALTGVYFLAIFLTNSRGAVLALVVMVAYYFRDSFKSVTSLALAAIFIAGVFALAPSRMSEVSSSESSAHERTWLWEQGLNLLKENPVLGVGRGQFQHRVDLGLLSHNNYVQGFAELGLVGFFLFLSVFWFSLNGVRITSTTLSHDDEGKQMASYARMISVAMIGFAAATFFVVMELDFYYFLLGLATATYLTARRRDVEIPVLKLDLKEFLVIVGAMATLIWAIWMAAVLQII